MWSRADKRLKKNIKEKKATESVKNNSKFWIFPLLSHPLDWTHLQHRLARGRVHPGVGGGLGRDGEALPLPQHGGGRVGHDVAADVDRVPLPRVVDGVVGHELGYVCGGHMGQRQHRPKNPTF